MTCRLHALCFDANHPVRLARFWAGVLGWEMTSDPADGVALRPADDTGFLIRFQPTSRPKAGQNPMHFDLTSTSLADQQHTVTRALELGARHIDIGQLPEEEHVVLADPEGNEFCVIEPGNNFLADCGFIGALACDGSRQVGYFWSEALGWPLVWDQNEETAIRSPRGGPKITWGGSPPMSRNGGNRQRFELAPPAAGDQRTESDLLVSLGATRIDTGKPEAAKPEAAKPEAGRIVLADPDGNEFYVLSAR